MFLTAGSTKLQRSFKNVRTHWESLSSRWRDSVAEDFEKTQIEAIEEHVVSTLREMNRLAEAMDRAKRDCEG